MVGEVERTTEHLWGGCSGCQPLGGSAERNWREVAGNPVARCPGAPQVPRCPARYRSPFGLGRALRGRREREEQWISHEDHSTLCPPLLASVMLDGSLSLSLPLPMQSKGHLEPHGGIPMNTSSSNCQNVKLSRRKIPWQRVLKEGRCS